VAAWWKAVPSWRAMPWRRWSGGFLRQSLLQIGGIIIVTIGLYAVLAANLSVRAARLAGEWGVSSHFTQSMVTAILLAGLITLAGAVLFAMHRLLERA
jgi:nitrate reductase gamma subunit